MHYVYVCQKGQHAASSSSPADGGQEEGAGVSGVEEGGEGEGGGEEEG